MTAPHPALVEVAAGRSTGAVADEEELLASAYEHRMAGEVLVAASQGRLPLSRSTRTVLGIWELRERREHLQFWETLRDVEGALAPMGVEVAVLKGIATEARWYDQPGQRVSTDLDLLLDPAALPRLAEVITRLDPTYLPTGPAAWLVDRQMLPHVDLHVGTTQVDLHFDPLKVGVPIRQLREVWATTEALPTPHGTIRVVAPEVELVLLLLHLNRDRFSYLGPFLDISRIITSGRVDWPRVESFVEGDGLQVPVWSSLEKVAEVLDLEVPRHPLSGPRASSWQRLWGPGHGLGGDSERAAANRPQKALPLHLRGRPREVLAGLRRELLPSRPLLEVAGRLDRDRSYARHLVAAVGRRVPGRSASPVPGGGNGNLRTTIRVGAKAAKGGTR